MVYTPRLREFMPDRSVDECLRLWGNVVYRASCRQHRDFAARIAHQACRPDWQPGPAQLDFMRKLVRIYAPDDIAIDPDFLDLIEDLGGAA